jgi:NurA-like 5'-3' nuclease
VEQLFTAEDEVAFFYLRVEDDIARVELPRWAAAPRRVHLLHATLADQCHRCGGYPRALQEAHEQAVISGTDRDVFEALLEKEAARAGVHGQVAGKAASKRRRML